MVLFQIMMGNFSFMLAKKFFQNVIETWKNGDVSHFEEIYSPDVRGALNQETSLTYTDIKNRFLYTSTHNINREFDIKEILIDGNKAALFFRYTAYDTKLKQAVDAPTLWIFTLKQEKISHVEILTSLQFNYHDTA